MTNLHKILDRLERDHIPYAVIGDAKGLHYVTLENVITDEDVWQDDHALRLMDYKPDSDGIYHWVRGGYDVEPDAQILAIWGDGRYETVQPKAPHADVQTLLEWSGMTRERFSTKYNFHYRTLQKWCLGTAEPKTWALILLERCVLMDYVLPQLEANIAYKLYNDKDEKEQLETFYKSINR